MTSDGSDWALGSGGLIVAYGCSSASTTGTRSGELARVAERQGHLRLAADLQVRALSVISGRLVSTTIAVVAERDRPDRRTVKGGARRCRPA